ncbi:MAG: hypothetical protein JJU34_14530 [Lunatimonas sp.]|uniref:hypothetical protein n=1 Tax=Lunatimonas sp. TaxID=2060141 RepID=UPI00263AB056|nr:hypothetical protein [Lunatimonas sp.]MCC5938492.1 hypothetical protein [Lunatimonas sp.]
MKHFFTGKYRKSCFFSERTGVIFLFLLCPGSLFGQTKERPQSMFCGTVSNPDHYKKAAFFGNNQLLVDNLIKEGFAIDKNYLDRLEDIQEISATRENMISSQIPLFPSISAYFKSYNQLWASCNGGSFPI